MGIEISNLICPECFNKFPIPRKSEHRRERGHRKWMWCPYCSKIVNMHEERSIDYGIGNDHPD